jgi:hypothetical protein
MSLGTGAVYSASKKQKLNTKSSTEAELVGIDDVLPQALWTKYFMEAQGYSVTTVLNQDNQSTIKLSENGKASSGKGARHINIRYLSLSKVFYSINSATNHGSGPDGYYHGGPQECVGC